MAPALPSEDLARFEDWRSSGMAADMTWMTDRRGDLRHDPRHLLPAAQSIVCLGKLYNTPQPHSQTIGDPARGWISRYAWGEDYHDTMRAALLRYVDLLAARHGAAFESRICVDTAPLLERSYARAAGLGWIGKNTCLINQERGSWFFLGEVLLSVPLEFDAPAPARCGVCTRCIDACPTEAIVEVQPSEWKIDARLCISYLTIEHRGAIPAPLAPAVGNHLFGCDICQDVCPWNRQAPVTADVSFAAAEYAPSLARLAALSEHEFRILFRHSPVWRAKYRGFLRNVINAMRNANRPEFRPPLEQLAAQADASVADAAREALACLDSQCLSPDSYR